MGARRPFLYRQKYVGYLLVAPSLLFLLVFLIVPILAAFYLSFTRYDLLTPPRWIGLDNYRNLLQDPRFAKAVVNTVLYCLLTIPTGTAIALLCALLVNRPLRGITAFRTALYLPVVTSFVAGALIWLWIYDPNNGLLNELFRMVGLPRFEWLHSTQTALISVVIFSVWKNVGYNMVIYLAGLQGIPEHIYEAAAIDGADRWAQFWGITLPLLSPTTFFVIVVWFIGALQMFIQVEVLTQGGPLDATITVVYLVYTTAFQNLRMGYAAAMSFLLFIFIGLVTYLNTRVLRNDVAY
jgi:ABC-type sugar transport system permease subunit